ncbi:hypothetical protein NCU05671 [Neurospora crassa OR74A]|uniref:Uncharacterized protein n=1 Tax=Neurospora crassa (strain ATCC 24698 / 74-OR23-1A / CBS 708.71 / DSM 1257 / FGSC 987) TaxID=367110 RepID=U9W2U6_NEUCR|nr:hypothetical protein NCU05671 [Neurospora crassa OR74A]ESA43127.1 hypothetical protein NCU05671 [Neurospora crassa OR74A]|eukprot:XP_011393867.1 hypothetical protein NCU05671 [Neurospora crassa OR74A]
MAELKIPAPPHDEHVSFVDDDLAVSQTRRMPEATTRDTPLRRRLKMCPDEDPTAGTWAPAGQLIENDDSQNSKDDTGGNIYETLLGRIQSTLQQLHDQHDQEETTKPSANPTSSRSTTDTHLDNLSSSSIPPTNEQPPTPRSKTFTRPSSSSTTKRKGSKSKQSGASMKIFAVKGTKAERLQECMEYFPKPPSPMPSPPASPGSGGNC